ncbi:MAG: helix-turn-helix transcriptional regulator [Acidobacteriota bacterium]|nr:helix-turn-helix transcriptional regulator [Acidobacteriota bacterium]
MDAPPPVVAVPAPAVSIQSDDPMPLHQLPVAQAIRSLRVRAGLSQRQLAARMSVPRTYVSKIENEKACPTLGSLERLAGALKVRVSDLLTLNRAVEDEVRELASDDFIAELMPFMRRLSNAQWLSVLNQIRDLAAMTRRPA